MKYHTLPRTGRHSLLAMIAALALALVMPAAATPPAEETPSYSASQLFNLAEDGRFAELLDQLRRQHQDTPAPGVDSLISDLERYQQNDAQRRQEQQQAYQEAMQKLQEQVDKDHFEAAIVTAIEAHSLAEQPDQLLQHELVVTLVRRAHDAAQEAEAENNWIHALSLYQLLDMLYDDHATFRDHARTARQRVRVLQLYAPQAAQTLHEAQRARNREIQQQQDEHDGETTAEQTQPEPVQLDHEPWQTRLQDVELSMLQATLRHAAHGHINAQPYKKLLQAATDALTVLVETQDLVESFPVFQDQQKINEFRTYLKQVGDNLRENEREPGFFEAARIIDRILFVNDQTINLPSAVLIYEMTEGMTQILDDYSGVIWPQDRSLLERSTEGRFAGIGVQISRRDGQLVVVSPLPNTPAQEAGIRAGDIIQQVDGVSTASWSLDRAVRHITGAEGTPVVLSIQRAQEPELRQYTITRATIDIASVHGWNIRDDGSWDYMIDPQNGIGYLRLSQFLRQTSGEMDQAIQAMQEGNKPLRGLILDLRFNPGGLLPAAVEVADRFLDQGPIVFTVDRHGQRTDDPDHRATPVNTYPHFPVVVLINQASASASEIVSGALQDYHRALIVGSRSFGKGSVQNVYQIDGGKAYLKLTFQHYMLPAGRIINRLPNADAWGVEPDLVVEMTRQQMEDALMLRRDADVLRSPDDPDYEDRPLAEHLLTEGLDPQLEAALLVLKTRVAAQKIALASHRPETAAVEAP